MKRALQTILARHPLLYRAALRAAGSRNYEKAAFLRLVRRGQIVLDVGANQGDFSLLFSDIVGPGGFVHAFEPVPPAFALLEKRIAGCRNVRLNRFGLADRAGVFPVHVPGSDFGQASMQRHSVASWSAGEVRTFQCALRTLDDYAAEERLDRLDFAKVDVEGAELLVIQGGRATLQRLRPVLHLEFFAGWTESFGYGSRELVSLLESLGYCHFYSGSLKPLDPAELEGATQPRNIISTATPLR